MDRLPGPTDQQALSDDALAMIREALDTGQFKTRMTGQIVKLGPNQWASLLLFLARRAKTPFRPLSGADDFRVKETH